MNKILEGKLILLASHNPLDIDLLCDCVYELDAETIVSQRIRYTMINSYSGFFYGGFDG